jgi:hypothetical protein
MSKLLQPSETKWSFIVPGSLMALGFFVLLLYSLFSTPNWADILSVVTMIMLSSFSVGALIGFIFGIPRTLQEDVKSGVKSNSNLEQLSDWLTKIIVGIGLVESKQVYELARNLAGDLSQGFPDKSLGFAIVFSTLIFYFFGGFFISYIWSRIFLERIFQQNIDTEGRLTALEQTKNMQEEINELQTNYSKEKAKATIDKTISQTTDSKEISNKFARIIGIAYEKLDYTSINQFITEYSNQIEITAATWTDVALANLNLYKSSRTQMYYDSTESACNKAIQLLYNFGTPQMVRIYLQLIDFMEASEENDLSKLAESEKNIKQIIANILKQNTICAYEAYTYMLRNDVTSYGVYNDILKTKFPDDYNALKNKYLEHLTKNQG